MSSAMSSAISRVEALDHPADVLVGPDHVAVERHERAHHDAHHISRRWFYEDDKGTGGIDNETDMSGRVVLGADRGACRECVGPCDHRDSGARYTVALETETRAGAQRSRRTRIIVCDARAGSAVSCAGRGWCGRDPRGTRSSTSRSAGGGWPGPNATSARRPSQATLTLRTADAVTRRAGQRRVLRRGAAVRGTDARVVVTARDDLWSVARGSGRSARRGGAAGDRHRGQRARRWFHRRSARRTPDRPASASAARRVHAAVGRDARFDRSGPCGRLAADDSVRNRAGVAVSLWWVCDRRTHRDAVVYQFGQSNRPTRPPIRPAGRDRRQLRPARRRFNKTLNAPALRLVDARTGATVRSVNAGEWPRPDP